MFRSVEDWSSLLKPWYPIQEILCDRFYLFFSESLDDPKTITVKSVITHLVFLWLIRTSPGSSLHTPSHPRECFKDEVAYLIISCLFLLRQDRLLCKCIIRTGLTSKSEGSFTLRYYPYYFLNVIQQ